MTYRLPFSDIPEDETRENFEAVEAQLSLFAFEDQIISAEVKGTKAKKIAVRDSHGKILGYVPLYAE